MYGDWRTVHGPPAGLRYIPLCMGPAALGWRPCEQSPRPMSSAAAELLKHFHHHRETVAPLRAALVQLSCGSSGIHSSRHSRWGGFAGLSRLPLSSLIDQQPARLPALRPALLRANNATRSNVAVAAPASAVSVLPNPSHLRATGRTAQRNTRHIASFGDPERHNNRRTGSGRAEIAAHGFLPRLGEC